MARCPRTTPVGEGVALPLFRAIRREGSLYFVSTYEEPGRAVLTMKGSRRATHRQQEQAFISGGVCCAWGKGRTKRPSMLPVWTGQCGHRCGDMQAYSQVSENLLFDYCSVCPESESARYLSPRPGLAISARRSTPLSFHLARRSPLGCISPSSC